MTPDIDPAEPVVDIGDSIEGSGADEDDIEKASTVAPPLLPTTQVPTEVAEVDVKDEEVGLDDDVNSEVDYDDADENEIQRQPKELDEEETVFEEETDDDKYESNTERPDDSILEVDLAGQDEQQTEMPPERSGEADEVEGTTPTP